MSDSDGLLSSAAVTVLEVAVARDAVPVSALPAEAGLSRSTVDSAVSELTRAGLVHVERGGSGAIRIEIGSPAALQGLIDSGRGLARPAALRLLQARRALDAVVKGSPALGAGVDEIVDLDELRSRIRDEVAGTSRELLSLHSGRPPTPEMMAASTPDDIQLMHRGVDLQVASPRSYADLAYMRDHVHTLAAAGARIRFADVVPHRLIVLDRRVAIVPRDVADPSRGALFIAERSLVQSLWYLARRILRSGRALEEITDDRDDHSPTPMERRVLLLMSTGVTDEVAARHLSITDRQFRRYVAAIMHRLGASSRFQTGVRAVERGWI